MSSAPAAHGDQAAHAMKKYVGVVKSYIEALKLMSARMEARAGKP